jgi:membrane-associated phospholipid phosphatase
MIAQQHGPATNRIAKLVSALLHQLLTPALAFIALIGLALGLELEQRMLLIAVALLFSVGLVVGYIFWLRRRGVIESVDILVREQRLNPLLVGATSYFLGFIALTLLDAPPLVQGLMFCYATNTLLVVLITRWWKVSVHTTAAGGPLVPFVFQLGASALPLLLLVPLVGWSRVALGRHTLAQVLVGGLVGVGLTALQLPLFLR